MKAIKVTFRRVGRGYRFVVQDPESNRYETYVPDSDPDMLIASASWLKRRGAPVETLDEALDYLEFRQGCVTGFRQTLPEFLDLCPFSQLEEVHEDWVVD